MPMCFEGVGSSPADPIFFVFSCMCSFTFVDCSYYSLDRNQLIQDLQCALRSWVQIPPTPHFFFFYVRELF
jgi:hypothetical protein